MVSVNENRFILVIYIIIQLVWF